MSKQIWKYSLRESTIRVPQHAALLSLQMQNGEPTMWVLVNPKAPLEAWGIHAVMTGEDLSDTPPGEYAGTVVGVEDWLVIHFWITRG